MQYEFSIRAEVVTKTDLRLNLTSEETDWLHVMVNEFDPHDMPSDMALFHKKLREILKR